MSTVIEQLLQEPTLPSVLKRLQELLEAEQVRRQHFYDVVTEEQKAEFINGEIVVHSPVKKQHATASSLLHHLLSVHVMNNNLGFVGYEKILVVLERNDYEPDLCFFNREKSQHFTEQQMKFPAPNLAIEVLSDSTASRDRGIKFRDYAISGVDEYWIVDPDAKMVEQYALVGDEYELRIKSDSGEIQSVAVPNFLIPIRAIFDEKTNLATLRKLLAV